MAVSSGRSPSAGRPAWTWARASRNSRNGQKTGGDSQLLVEVHAAPDVGQAFVEAPELDLGGPEQAAPGRRPDPELVLVGQLTQPDREVERDLGVASPEVQEARVEAGVGRGERMLQLDGERQRRVRALGRAIGIAEQPQGERGGRQAGDPGVVPDPRRPRSMPLGREQGDRLVELIEPAVQVVGGHERRADQQVPVDEHARVVLALPEGEDLPAEAAGLVELAAEQVEAREASEHGVLLAHVAAALEQLHGARERGLDLRGEALGRHERPGEARPQGDLLAGPVGRWRDRPEDGEQVLRQAHRVEVPAVGVVEDQQRTGQLVELLEVALGHPVRPGDPQVRDVGAKVGQRSLALCAGQVRQQPARSVREVRRVRPPSTSGDVGACLEPVGRELPDRLQHRHARLATRRVDQADEALLDEPGEAVEDVHVDVVDRPETGDHGLDRADLRLREHGQQLEQALLARAQELVAPVHRRPQRLLSLRKVARPAAQEPQPVPQAVPQHLRREESQARRRELDRQGQAVEPAADLGHGRGVVVGQLRSRGGPRAPGRRTAGRPRTRRSGRPRPPGRPAAGRAAGPGRRRSARTCSASRLVASTVSRGQSLSSRATMPAASVTCSKLSSTRSICRSRRRSMSSSCQRPIDDLAEPDGPGDRDEDGVRVPGAGQVDEGDAVREAGREVLGDPDRQRRLAGAPGPDQREQADRSIREAIA